jgi:hypothetical protein
MARRKRRAGRRGPAKKKWAFLVYIAGDNNLSDAGLADIQELCDEGASDDVHVGVEIDTVGEHTGSIRYEITPPDWNGKAHRVVLERLPEKDSGDPETLRSFLAWGRKRFPAKNTLVVVWNHGAGFRSPRRDVAYDDFGSSLDMPEVEGAFKRAGFRKKSRLALLGFDACLMNMLEIAHHFRDQTGIVVGSQQTDPANGWPYSAVLGAMKKASSGEKLARKIVDLYIESYRKAGVFDVTQSAVDTKKTDAAVRALGKLGRILAKRIDKHREALERARMQAQTFEMADYVDLVHLARLFGEATDDRKIRDGAKALVDAARACIVKNGNLGAGVRDAAGLSVWFPARADLYQGYRAKYLALRLNRRKPSGWVAFLDAYHA